jgi:hypothetical protein
MTDDTLTKIGANRSMRFLHGKLAEIIPRLYAQVTKVESTLKRVLNPSRRPIRAKSRRVSDHER